MTFTVIATIEDGTFKRARPVALPKGTKIRLSITPEVTGSEGLIDKERAALVARG